MRDSVPQVPQCRDHLALMVVQRKATSAVQPFNALLDADALKISLVELARGDLGFPGYKQLVIRDRQPCLQQQFESCRQVEDGKFPLVPVVLPRIVNGRLDEYLRVAEQAKRVLVVGFPVLGVKSKSSRQYSASRDGVCDRKSAWCVGWSARRGTERPQGARFD